MGRSPTLPKLDPQDLLRLETGAHEARGAAYALTDSDNPEVAAVAEAMVTIAQAVESLLDALRNHGV